MATVLSGGRHNYVVFPWCRRGVVAGPPRRERLIRDVCPGRQAEINVGLGTREEGRTLQILVCEMLGDKSRRSRRRSGGERCCTSDLARGRQPGTVENLRPVCEIVANALQEADCFERYDLSAAAAYRHCRISIRTDD